MPCGENIPFLRFKIHQKYSERSRLEVMLTNRKTLCVCAFLTAALLSLFTNTPSIKALLSISQLQKDIKERESVQRNIFFYYKKHNNIEQVTLQ